MNLVEMLIFGAACSFLSEKEIESAMGCKLEELAALNIIAQGMRKLKFRYRKGILEDPIYNFYYEGLAGLTYIEDYVQKIPTSHFRLAKV